MAVLMVAIVYWLSLWRIIKESRGNRVIECGSIALIIALLMVALIKFPNLPDGVQPSLTAATPADNIFPVASRRSSDSTVQVFNRRLRQLCCVRTRLRTSQREKEWMLRIVYWGTSLVCAFIWWEYVKAR
jgi:Flp pilus assembly pilin Flp